MILPGANSLYAALFSILPWDITVPRKTTQWSCLWLGVYPCIHIKMEVFYWAGLSYWWFITSARWALMQSALYSTNLPNLPWPCASSWLCSLQACLIFSGDPWKLVPTGRMTVSQSSFVALSSSLLLWLNLHVLLSKEKTGLPKTLPYVLLHDLAMGRKSSWEMKQRAEEELQSSSWKRGSPRLWTLVPVSS